MDHSFYQERLSAYLDRELPDDEMKAVEEHLAGCEECGRRLAQLKSLDDFSARFSELDDSDYWEESARKIEARIEVGDEKIVDVKKARRGLYSGLWWKLPAVAASVLIVGYIGLHESEITDDGRLLAPRREPVPTEESKADSIATTDTLIKSRSASESSPESETSARSEEQSEHLDRTDADAVGETTADDEEGWARSAEAPTTPPQPSAEDKATTQLVAPAPAELQASRAETPDLKADRYKQTTPAATTSGGETESAKPKDTLAKLPAPNDYIPSATGGTSEKPEKANDTRDYAQRSILALKEKAVEDRDDVLELLNTLDEASGEPSDVMEEMVESGELAIWRARRDSLQTLRETLAANPHDESRPASKILSAAKGGKRSSGASSLAPSPDTSTATLEQVSNELVEAWYRVCLLSEDETEVARGMKFLEEAARDKHTESGRRAGHFLELLDR